MLASPNGVSLFLEFDAILGGCVGKMPVMFANGEFRSLLTGVPVFLSSPGD